MTAIGDNKYGAPTIVSSSTQIKTGPQLLVGVALVGGAAAAGVLELKNAATDTGTINLTVKALTGDTTFLDLSELAIPFSTAMYAKIAGSGAIAYIWTA